MHGRFLSPHALVLRPSVFPAQSCESPRVGKIYCRGRCGKEKRWEILIAINFASDWCVTPGEPCYLVNGPRLSKINGGCQWGGGLGPRGSHNSIFPTLKVKLSGQRGDTYENEENDQCR